MSMIQHRQRDGVVLIVVVGLAVILLAVSASFFSRMRSDAQESEVVLQEVQARIMLQAAMNYIQEGARIGWDDPGTVNVMEEAFGWTDIRATGIGPINGMRDMSLTALKAADSFNAVGPRDQQGNLLYTSTETFPHPGGRAVRCPMYAMRRPPYAVTDRLVANPMVAPDTDFMDQNLDYDMLNLPVEPVAKDWNEFVDGDLLPRLETVGLAWFRVYREPEEMHDGDRNNYVSQDPENTISDWYDVEAMPGHHGIFIVTCGSGGTLGYRDWDEVLATTDATNRPFDQATFESLRESERILWYRVEWSAGVLAGSYANVGQERNFLRFRVHDGDDSVDDDVRGEMELTRNPPVVTRSFTDKSGKYWTDRAKTDWDDTKETNAIEGGVLARNQTGTIDWIMRLEREPPEW